MISPSDYYKETERLKDLASYSILDTMPETDFDYLTSIASEICGTPISLISLIDNKRQWFKSHHGLTTSETPKEYAFCGHAINEPNKTLIVEDSRKDIRFHDNPLVTKDPHVIFYAGVPLISEDGFPLGTLCVIDNKPRTLTEGQINSLNSLAKQVMNLIILRKKKEQLELSLKELDKKNKELEQFIYIASHDLSEPLNTVSSFIQILEENTKEELSEIEKKSFQFINDATVRMKKLIKGLLDYSTLGNKEVSKKVDCNVLVQSVIKDLDALIKKNKATIYIGKLPTINVFEIEMELLFQNLITNALKFRKPDVDPEISITCEKLESGWKFLVKDNGIGIDAKYQKKVFTLFQKLHNHDKYKGTGIGLAHCQKIVDLHNGKIWFESELGIGSVFQFTVNKKVK